MRGLVQSLKRHTTYLYTYFNSHFSVLHAVYQYTGEVDHVILFFIVPHLRYDILGTELLASDIISVCHIRDPFPPPTSQTGNPTVRA